MGEGLVSFALYDYLPFRNKLFVVRGKIIL